MGLERLGGVTSLNLSAKEAKKLGIDLSKAKPVPARKRHTGDRSAKYHTRCHGCEEEFTTAASEDRHVAEHHHHRFELVLERNP